MHILAGLGNPGQKYANHRHNVGYMAVERIASRHGFSPWTGKFRSQVAEGRLGGEKVLLLKPQTFMNLSGEAVGQALRFYRLEPGDLTAIHDELDLAPGRIRVKTGGGAGGHNGIRSLDAHCGPGYHRLRIGIGHPGDKTLVTPHVLGDFSREDRQWLEPLLDAIAEHAGLLALRDHAGFMNRVQASLKGDRPAGQSHVRQARPKPVSPPAEGPMAALLKKLFGKD
jgi:PTH1 family peptidyl-tRNA hydrolase